MTIQELPADRRQQPSLIPISREDHIVASIGICRVEPRPVAAIGKMHASRFDIEDKIEAIAGEPVGEFNILGASKAFIETACSQDVTPPKRGIARVELPRRR